MQVIQSKTILSLALETFCGRGYCRQLFTCVRMRQYLSWQSWQSLWDSLVLNEFGLIFPFAALAHTPLLHLLTRKQSTTSPI